MVIKKMSKVETNWRMLRFGWEVVAFLGQGIATFSYGLQTSTMEGTWSCGDHLFGSHKDSNV